MLRVSFIDPLHWSRDLKVWERELAPRIQAERPAGDKAQRQEHVWHVGETARRPIWQSRVSQGERSMRWGRRGDGSQIASGLTRPMEECWFLLWGTKMKDHCRVLSEGVITTMITHMQTLLRVRLYKKKKALQILAHLICTAFPWHRGRYHSHQHCSREDAEAEKVSKSPEATQPVRGRVRLQNQVRRPQSPPT